MKTKDRQDMKDLENTLQIIDLENDDIEELISEYEEDYSNYEDYTDEAEYSEIDGNSEEAMEVSEESIEESVEAASEESSDDGFVLLSDVVSDEERMGYTLRFINAEVYGLTK